MHADNVGSYLVKHVTCDGRVMHVVLDNLQRVWEEADEDQEEKQPKSEEEKQQEEVHNV